MGICYSEEQQWNSYNKNYRQRRKKHRNKTRNSVIYEQKTIYEASFNSGVQSSFRQTSHPLNTLLSEDSIAMGSLTQLSEEGQQALQKSLETINSEGEIHCDNEVISLSNLKSKNFLHTHRVKLPTQCRENEISCCPYNSSHMVEYDLWRLVKAEAQTEKYYIYHPFTQRFLNIKKNEVVCSEDKMEWEVKSYGIRRNGGYLRIFCQSGELCMTSDRGLLTNHRKLTICSQKHVSHIWEIRFGEAVDMSDQRLA